MTPREKYLEIVKKDIAEHFAISADEVQKAIDVLQVRDTLNYPFITTACLLSQKCGIAFSEAVGIVKEALNIEWSKLRN